MLVAPLRRWPYFAQWGAPTFSWSSTLTMLAGAISAMVESVCTRPSILMQSSSAYPMLTCKGASVMWHAVSATWGCDGARCLVWRSWEITMQRRASAAPPCRRQVSSPGP